MGQTWMMFKAAVIEKKIRERERSSRMAKDEICGAMLPLLRLSRDEATRFAICRLPVGHSGDHSEHEGLHPISWSETRASGVVQELKARRNEA